MNSYFRFTISLLALFLLTISHSLSQSSDYVGTIEGAIDVTATGAATYNIPINVIPGTQGLQPNISVYYDSQSGFGLFGKKWHLSGLSSIVRVSQNLYIDNNITGVNLNEHDKFALDGNRLISINGAYGGNNTEYKTICCFV